MEKSKQLISTNYAFNIEAEGFYRVVVEVVSHVVAEPVEVHELVFCQVLCWRFSVL